MTVSGVRSAEAIGGETTVILGDATIASVYTSAHPAPMKRTILHTEASIGFGGQEVRILTETRWLVEHGWPALIAAQPASRLLVEATAAESPPSPWPMPHPGQHPRDAAHCAASWAKAPSASSTPTAPSTAGWPPWPREPRPARRAQSSRLHPRPGSPRADLPPRPPRHHQRRARSSADRGRRVPARHVVAIPAGIDTERFHAGVSGAEVRAEFGIGRAPRRAGGEHSRVEGAPGSPRGSPARARPATRPRFLIVGDGVGFDDVRRRHRAWPRRSRRDDGIPARHPRSHGRPRRARAASLRSEAAPQVVPQALAVGTPVIGTAVGGIPEIVRDGETGRLVPPEDAPALAEAILEVSPRSGAARAMARRGQALVRERFTSSHDAGDHRRVRRAAPPMIRVGPDCLRAARWADYNRRTCFASSACRIARASSPSRPRKR